MRRVRKLGTVCILIAASLMMSGCISTVDRFAMKIADAIPDPDQAFSLKNNSKNTDNLQPWKIKKSNSDHFILDAFYALPQAHTRAEAKEQIAKLLGHSKGKWVLQATWNEGDANKLKHRKRLHPNWVFMAFFEGQGDKTKLVIKEKWLANEGYKIQYIKFKPLKINDIYYMVVADTNAKNVGFLGITADVFREAWHDPNGLKTNKDHMSYGNRKVCKSFVQAANATIKRYHWEDMFVDIHLDSKNQKAEKYRKIFVDFFRKEGISK